MRNEILLEYKKYVNSNKVNRNYTIGTIIRFIYSKDVFKNNKDIAPFLKEVFNEEYLPYVMKSRTLIAAKLGRVLSQLDENSYKNISQDLLIYFETTHLNNISNSDEKIDIKKSKSKKKNANDKLDSWLRGI